MITRGRRHPGPLTECAAAKMAAAIVCGMQQSVKLNCEIRCDIMKSVQKSGESARMPGAPIALSRSSDESLSDPFYFGKSN